MSECLFASRVNYHTIFSVFYKSAQSCTKVCSMFDRGSSAASDRTTIQESVASRRSRRSGRSECSEASHSNKSRGANAARRVVGSQPPAALVLLPLLLAVPASAERYLDRMRDRSALRFSSWRHARKQVRRKKLKMIYNRHHRVHGSTLQLPLHCNCRLKIPRKRAILAAWFR